MVKRSKLVNTGDETNPENEIDASFSPGAEGKGNPEGNTEDDNLDERTGRCRD